MPDERYVITERQQRKNMPRRRVVQYVETFEEALAIVENMPGLAMQLANPYDEDAR